MHDGEQVRLVRNLDGGEPAEIEYAHLGSLIQVDSTTESIAWKLWAQSHGIILIRENEY